MASLIVDPKQLKRIRVELGITQARLADEAGVSQSLIAKIESGRVDPTYGSMHSISKALNSRRSSKGKKASEVMSSPVITVESTSKVSDCIALMKKKGISQVPIVERERPVGSMTEARILQLVSESRDPTRVLAMPVSRFLGPLFPMVAGDAPAEALLSLFSHVPAVLVSTGGRIEGVIAKIDLLAATVS